MLRERPRLRTRTRPRWAEERGREIRQWGKKRRGERDKRKEKGEEELVAVIRMEQDNRWKGNRNGKFKGLKNVERR